MNFEMFFDVDKYDYGLKLKNGFAAGQPTNVR